MSRGFAPFQLDLARRRHNRLQVFAELAAELRVRERIFHGRLQIAELAAAVVALAFEAMRVYRLLAHERTDAIGELNLPARAMADLFQMPEDCGCQDITADDGEIRGCDRRLGLLDDAADAAGD